MRFAQEHATEDEVRTGFALLRTWTAVRDSLASSEAEVPTAQVAPTGNANVLAFPPELTRAGLDYQRRRREFAEDEARHGPNRTSAPPITAEAERLRDALRNMTGGAQAIVDLVVLEPFVALMQLVGELPPSIVARQLRIVRAAHDHVALAFRVQRPIDVEPAATALEMFVDPDRDIEGRAIDLFDDANPNRQEDS